MREIDRRGLIFVFPREVVETEKKNETSDQFYWNFIFAVPRTVSFAFAGL